MQRARLQQARRDVGEPVDAQQRGGEQLEDLVQHLAEVWVELAHLLVRRAREQLRREQR